MGILLARNSRNVQLGTAIDKGRATATFFGARWYNMIYALGLQVGTPSRSKAVHSANATNLSHPQGRRFICDGRCCLPTFIGITNQMKNMAVCIG